MTLTTDTSRATVAGGGRFVGREPELGLLNEAAAVALTGGEQVVVEVVGEPGIGKTRLVQQALGGWAAQRLRLLGGSGAEVERLIPFHVFRHALERRRLGADPGPDQAVEPEPGPLRVDAAPERVDVRRFRTYQAARRLLERAAYGGLVLVLDDLHWADHASTGLIRHLLRHPVRAPLLVVLVYRPRQMSTRAPFGLSGPDTPGGATSAVPARRIELGPFSVHESARLLGEPADSAGLRRRHAASGGNPLYLAATGATDRDDDRALTDTVVTRLLSEWSALPPVELTVLASAAVLGDRFDVAMLAAVAEMPVQAATEAACRIARRDLLRYVPGTPVFAFRHPVLRRAAYGSIDPFWRAGAHRRALGELVRRGVPTAAYAIHLEPILTRRDPVEGAGYESLRAAIQPDEPVVPVPADAAATGPAPGTGPALDQLTERERQIAGLAATAATTRSIGRALGISPRTVEAHLSRIYRKLDLSSRTGLVALVTRARGST